MCKTFSPINQTCQALDASEGGLQILFPEHMEIGQNLNLKLFFSSGSELNTIEMLAMESIRAHSFG